MKQQVKDYPIIITLSHDWSPLVDHQTMESVESYLQIAIEKYNSLSNDQIFSLFYLNHSFIIANIVYSQLTAPGGRRGTPLLFGLLLCIVTGLGGSILCNFLLGKPQILLDNDIFIGYMLIAWVFTVYLPPMRWLVNFPLVSVCRKNLFNRLINQSWCVMLLKDSLFHNL